MQKIHKLAYREAKAKSAMSLLSLLDPSRGVPRPQSTVVNDDFAQNLGQLCIILPTPGYRDFARVDFYFGQFGLTILCEESALLSYSESR
jgi:hypothetical protein